MDQAPESKGEELSQAECEKAMALSEEVEASFAEQPGEVMGVLPVDVIGKGGGRQRSAKHRVLAVTLERGPQGKQQGCLHALRRTSEGKLAEAESFKLRNIARLELRPDRGRAFVVHLESKGQQPLEAGTEEGMKDLEAFLGKLCVAYERVTLEALQVDGWGASAREEAIQEASEAFKKSSQLGQEATEWSDMMVGEQESSRIEALLAKYKLDVSEAQLFEERLHREVAALENASVEKFLEARSEVGSIVSTVQRAQRQAEDLKAALTMYIDNLSTVKESADLIDRRSHQSRAYGDNSRALLHTLSELLSTLSLPNDIEQRVRFGTLEVRPLLLLLLLKKKREKKYFSRKSPETRDATPLPLLFFLLIRVNLRSHRDWTRQQRRLARWRKSSVSSRHTKGIPPGNTLSWPFTSSRKSCIRRAMNSWNARPSEISTISLFCYCEC